MRKYDLYKPTQSLRQCNRAYSSPEETAVTCEASTTYDLSKIPRPLYSPKLLCWTAPRSDGWHVLVGNDDFSAVVARPLGQPEALKIVTEVRGVLQASRVLAGTSNDNYVR